MHLLWLLVLVALLVMMICLLMRTRTRPRPPRRKAPQEKNSSTSDKKNITRTDGVQEDDDTLVIDDETMTTSTYEELSLPFYDSEIEGEHPEQKSKDLNICDGGAADNNPKVAQKAASCIKRSGGTSPLVTLDCNENEPTREVAHNQTKGGAQNKGTKHKSMASMPKLFSAASCLPGSGEGDGVCYAMVACEYYRCRTRALRSKMKKCARCSKIIYCSKECQESDWKRHMRECYSNYRG